MRTFPGCVLLLLPTLAGVVVFGLVGCEPEVPGTLEGLCDDDRYAEVTSQEYFETEIRDGIFEPHCAYCHWSDKTGDARHGAPIGVDYDTADAAASRIAGTWFRVSTYDMPPMGKVPSLDQMAVLNEWLNCAMVERPGDDDDSAR